MAEETTPTEVETAPETPVTPAETAPAPPHPLKEGGVRFEEVYRQLKEAERDNASLRERMARVEGQVAATPKPQAQQQVVYTPEQLQAFVDQGRISPAQMASQIALQHTAASEERMLKQLEHRTRATAASGEVQDYVSKIPALNSNSSAEFSKVSRIANEIADETGLAVSNPIVQRRALREAFGPLEKIAKVEQAREFDRKHADTHVEAGGGGGAAPSKADPLKNVEPERIAFWNARGYTREQMIEEAAHIRRPLRKVTG